MRSQDKPSARELIEGLLFLSKSETFRRTYERLAPGADGRIRTVHNPAATDTGRYNSSDTFLEASTNLQNCSKKFAKLDPIFNTRDIFIPEQGNVIGEADLSQAEARVAAWMANDPLAIEQYARGEDRYWFLAAAAFYDDPTHPRDAASKEHKMQRDVGKMGLLAFQYGVSWKTWMEQTNHSSDLTGVVVNAQTAKRVEGTFFELWPNYRAWWHEIEDTVLSRGYLINPFGRRRDFFGRADSESARSALRRAAVAFMPQSTVADLTNLAMCLLYENFDPHLLQIHLQVHDALVFQCKIRDYPRVARLVKQTMEIPLTINERELIIPAEVGVSTRAWSKLKEVA